MYTKSYVQIALECKFMAITWLHLLLTLFRVDFREFGHVVLDMYTLGIKDCPQNWSGSLAKEETLPRTHWCKTALHYSHCPFEWVCFLSGYNTVTISDITVVEKDTPIWKVEMSNSEPQNIKVFEDVGGEVVGEILAKSYKLFSYKLFSC